MQYWRSSPVKAKGYGELITGVNCLMPVWHVPSTRTIIYTFTVTPAPVISSTPTRHTVQGTHWLITLRHPALTSTTLQATMMYILSNLWSHFRVSKYGWLFIFN